LRRRISQHLANIRAKNTKPISVHFNLPTHTLKDFKFQGIDLCCNSRNILELEGKWMTRLNTLHPKGINVMTHKTPSVIWCIPFNYELSHFCYKATKTIQNETNRNIILAYKRSKNIKEILCPSNIF
jgi:hypothetical protein